MPAESGCKAPLYRGRFAPSPTGPLHLGSLLAATLSYLDARANGGSWLVRIEDIDPLREMPGASASILRSLERHGLCWDDRITYQSARRDHYDAFIARLSARNRVYACPCSRKERSALGGKHLPHCGYHGRPPHADDSPAALRFRLATTAISFTDCIQGPVHRRLRSSIDDFVVRRREGYYAYQLAVVADDSQQGITHVIRGLDLIESTPLQLALYQACDLTPPQFGHFFLLTDEHGVKLSKQNRAPALDDTRATDNLLRVLKAAGFVHPSLHTATTPESLLAAACTLWDRNTLARRPAVCLDHPLSAASHGSA